MQNPSRSPFALPRSPLALGLLLALPVALSVLVARRSLGQHLERMPQPSEVLAGRATPIVTPGRHAVFNTPLNGSFPGSERVLFGMGCFWGAEEHFFHVPGVLSTAVGYAGGATPNPTYDEVCSGRTGHSEVVSVVYDPRRVSFDALLRIFWEGHDPTQGMRQGNDTGTQYRSVIYTFTEAQHRTAVASRDAYTSALRARGLSAPTTELREGVPFFFAEAYHQQYCALNPHGYCGHGGTGVPLPTFTVPAAAAPPH